MNVEEQLTKQLEAALAQALRTQSEIVTQAGGSAETDAVSELHDETAFWQRQLHSEQIADMQAARAQREEYARKVFLLVGCWIAALFLILLAQGSSPTWHPFSDKVLIALISSMTVNLIGTLVIVLNYIFRAEKVRW